MSVFKRGGVYWYKFRFQGQEIRESAHTRSKTIAREAERVRHRELEMAINHIPKRERIPLFPDAAKAWLKMREATVAPKTYALYQHFTKSLTGHFGQRLVCDIRPEDIAALQLRRRSEGKSPRTVNMEVNALRQILKHHGLWGAISDRVRHLRERQDIGKAISPEDEKKLIDASAESRSPALLPLFVISIDAGLRRDEIRSLRHKDLRLNWDRGSIIKGAIVVCKSKTDAGAGRVVPLTLRACAVLTLWLARFPTPGPDDFVFPRFSVGISGNKRSPIFANVDPKRAIGEWKKAWHDACAKAGVHYRWHDCRHTFITRLCEDPTVSEETIRALAGHVSKKMLERYSHIRMKAKENAIAALEANRLASQPEFEQAGVQNRVQPEQLN